MKKYMYSTEYLLTENTSEFGLFHLPGILKLEQSHKINLVD